MKNLQLTTEFKARYDLVRRLGVGGMGALYLAQDKKLDRQVAIKFIHADTAYANLQRFKREAEVQMGLKHSNIAQLLDYSAEGTPYIVFERVKGETLFDKLLEGKLSSKEACQFGIEICEGMAYAANLGVVHRDLKSENIMITDQGQVKIIDFGLARQKEVSVTVTQTGEFLGTPAYIAPEVAQGKKTTVKADIYAVGVILFEMVVGDTPYKDNNVLKIFSSKIKDPTPDVRDFCEGIDDSFASIIKRAMEKSPRNRYSSFEELLTDLKAWEKGEKPVTPKKRKAKRPQRQRSSQQQTMAVTSAIKAADLETGERSPLKWVALLLVLLLLVGGVSYYSFFSGPPEWVKTVKVKAAATNAEVTWQSKEAKQFSYKVVGADDMRLVLRGKEKAAEKSHRVDVSGLNIQTRYDLELTGDGHTVTRSFVTSTASLTKGVFACVFESRLYFDFKSKLDIAFKMKLFDSQEEELLSRKCKANTPTIIQLPKKDVKKPLRWKLICDDQQLASGEVAEYLTTYDRPLRRHFQAKGRVLDRFSGSTLLWRGEKLFAVDLDGGVSSYALKRATGEGKGRDTLSLLWYFRNPANPPYGQVCSTGGMTALADGRILVTAIQKNGKGQIHILSPKERERVWQQRRGFKKLPQLPTWVLDKDSRWCKALSNEEFIDASFIANSLNGPNGLYHKGKAYFFTIGQGLFNCHEIDIATKARKDFPALELKTLKSATGLPRTWLSIAQPRFCGGRVFTLLRTYERTRERLGPFEYALVSWNLTTGQVKAEDSFKSYCARLQPKIDGKKATLWVTNKKSFYRLKVRDGKILQNKKISFESLHKAQGTILGSCFPTANGLFFTRHESGGYFTTPIELGPGVVAGHMFLYKYDQVANKISKYTPTLDKEPDTLLAGGFHDLQRVGSALIAFEWRKIFAFKIGTSQNVRSFSIYPIDTKLKETMCAWAINDKGYIALSTRTGKIVVMPLELLVPGIMKNL